MLTVSCRCGKKYQVDDRFAGRRVKCRACGKRIAVPLAQDSATAASGPVREGMGTASEGATYRVIRPFAKGGMGKISIARDVPLKRDVALKELRDSAADNLCRESRHSDLRRGGRGTGAVRNTADSLRRLR
jgi:serine/threonine protein kinase